ncbi:MAG: hypothetical protein U9O87_10505 [Verrucomicrobiota bacterium]|nr:hypothetical protein [Verrucomicrobiota bacterium]
MGFLKNCFFYPVEGVVEDESKKQYTYLSTEYLGKYLTEEYPDSKIVIIYSSISVTKIQQLRLEGLRKGLSDDCEIIKQVGLPFYIPGGIPQCMISLNEFLKAKDFNDVFLENEDADMFISLVGLPEDLNKMSLWEIESEVKRPKLIVFGGDVSILKEAIINDYIQALIVYRQMDNSVNKLPPDNLKEAFSRRFMLITPKNIENLIKKYPILISKSNSDF